MADGSYYEVFLQGPSPLQVSLCSMAAVKHGIARRPAKDPAEELERLRKRRKFEPGAFCFLQCFARFLQPDFGFPCVIAIWIRTCGMKGANRLRHARKAGSRVGSFLGSSFWGFGFWGSTCSLFWIRVLRVSESRSRGYEEPRPL